MGVMADRDTFLMDVENRMLEAWAWAECPKGKGHVREAAWVSHVRACLAKWYGGRCSSESLVTLGMHRAAIPDITIKIASLCVQ